MKTKMRLIVMLMVLGIIMLACGQFSVGLEQPTPEPVENTPAAELSPEATTDSQARPSDVRDDTSQPDYSEYWTVVEDYRTGLRFAIPCFWVANIPAPEQDPTGLGSFSVNNFTEEYIFSLGPKRGGTVWDLGGMKFDLGYHQRAELGLSAGATLEEVAYKIINPDEEHGIYSTRTIQVNGKDVLQVETWSNYGGDGRLYLLPAEGDLVIMFAPYPADNPDFQGILNSFATDPEQRVILPTFMPADPPQGFAVSCMPVLNTEVPITPPEEVEVSTLDCQTVTDQQPLMWTMCNVRDSILSRNTQPLMGYMSDPFVIGYWQSEGATRTREEAFNEIVQMHLADTPGGETFTTDHTQFPPLFGQPAENMFGPDDAPAAVLYSEGWGKDGQGAALLYFKEGNNGRYVFYAIVIAQGHFDK